MRVVCLLNSQRGHFGDHSLLSLQPQSSASARAVVYTCYTTCQLIHEKQEGSCKSIPSFAEYLMQSARKKSTNILLFHCRSSKPTPNLLEVPVGELRSLSGKAPTYSRFFTFCLGFLPVSSDEIYFGHLRADLCVYIFREIRFSIWIFKSVFRSSSKICKLFCCQTRQGQSMSLREEHQIL